jgi:hypothetical protein
MINDSESRLAALARPFPADRVEWRIQSSGLKPDGTAWARVLCYITQRAAFERLDEVYGEHWSHEETFHTIGAGAVCTVRISIHIPNTLSREVSGTCAVDLDKAGDIDPFKTAASGALKRAVVALRVGRYLYDLEEAWAEVLPKGGLYKAAIKDRAGNKVWFTWNPPKLPAWALPGASAPAPAKSAAIPEDIEIPPFEEPDAPASATLVEFAPDPSRFKANPEAAPAAQAPAPAAQGGYKRKPLEEDPVIPFGRSKGQRLSELSDQDLAYFADKWEPRPYEKTGNVTLSDSHLKKRAQEVQAARAGKSASADQDDQAPPVLDDVPF